MSPIKDIPIQDFLYPLPDERIARYPLEKRDQSNLLIYQNGQIHDDKFNNISQHLPEKALMVLNNTRVIQARLAFKKSSGAEIEILCLEPWPDNNYQASLQSHQKVCWQCMIGNAKKWKEGTLTLNCGIQNKIKLQATLLEKKTK